MRPEINPEPTPEEAAAIVAAVESLRGEGEASGSSEKARRSRWEIAGRLGRPLPGEINLEGSLWPVASRGRSL